MSLTTTLSNAYSGLVAASKAAELVSSNTANAMTETYGRRELALSAAGANGVGGGVRIDGVVRAADARATADRRRADATGGAADIAAEASARLAQVYGEPGAEGALGATLLAFETAVTRAAESPESTTLQASLLGAARSVAAKISQISTETRRLRTEADASIRAKVDTVNSSLQAIEQINREIQIRASAGADVSALEDQRQGLLDKVNLIVPIRVARRDGDQVAVYSTGGATLLDGRAYEIGFTATATITADMTLASGGLSGLTLNAKDVTVGEGGGRLDGGTLAAAFRVRDVTGPAADAQIDAFARDLMERMEAVDTDAGGAGLFTDAGDPFDATVEVGLAGRIAVNAAVDPDAGGALWRLRDGLAAATQGLAGDETLLRAIADALVEDRAAAGATGVIGMFGAADLAGEIAAVVGNTASREEAEASYAQGQTAIMREAEIGVTGVDTDQEAQRLLLIEQAYSANARVISVVSTLIDRLLEI